MIKKSISVTERIAVITKKMIAAFQGVEASVLINSYVKVENTKFNDDSMIDKFKVNFFHFQFVENIFNSFLYFIVY